MFPPHPTHHRHGHVGEERVALFAAVRALEIIAELKGVIKIKAHGFDEDCREVVERVLTAKDELGGEVSVLQSEVVFGHRF